MLVLVERGKPEYPEENLLEQGREAITCGSTRGFQWIGAKLAGGECFHHCATLTFNSLLYSGKQSTYRHVKTTAELFQFSIVIQTDQPDGTIRCKPAQSTHCTNRTFLSNEQNVLVLNNHSSLELPMSLPRSLSHDPRQAWPCTCNIPILVL